MLLKDFFNFNDIKVLIGGFGSLVAGMFGGWTLAMNCVIYCMAIDFILGITNATIFKNSQKTKTGRMSSNEVFKGLLKKCVLLSFIVLGNQIDLAFNFSYVKDGLCVAVAVGEITSIIENSKLMGVKVPKVLSDIVDVLSSKEA